MHKVVIYLEYLLLVVEIPWYMNWDMWSAMGQWAGSVGTILAVIIAFKQVSIGIRQMEISKQTAVDQMKEQRDIAIKQLEEQRKIAEVQQKLTEKQLDLANQQIEEQRKITEESTRSKLTIYARLYCSETFIVDKDEKIIFDISNVGPKPVFLTGARIFRKYDSGAIRFVQALTDIRNFRSPLEDDDGFIEPVGVDSIVDIPTPIPLNPGQSTQATVKLSNLIVDLFIREWLDHILICNSQGKDITDPQFFQEFYNHFDLSEFNSNYTLVLYDSNNDSYSYNFYIQLHGEPNKLFVLLSINSNVIFKFNLNNFPNSTVYNILTSHLIEIQNQIRR